MLAKLGIYQVFITAILGAPNYTVDQGPKRGRTSLGLSYGVLVALIVIGVYSYVCAEHKSKMPKFLQKLCFEL